MAGPPTALIAEDERVLRQELRGHLRSLWPGLEVIGEAADGIDAMRQLDQRTPDVAFLDIQMPGMSGLDVARHIDGRCHVVFVTAYEAYAVAAFEQGALDYVLKPYDVPRLAATIRRVRQRLGTHPRAFDGLLSELAAAIGPREYLRWINAPDRDQVRLIAVDEVQYFQADHGYTRVVSADGEALIQRSLKELAEQLDPACFWPIHRSTIVNANAVAGVSRDLRGRIFVKLKARPEKLAVSEAHEHRFQKM